MGHASSSEKRKACVYIDGFNLYYSMRANKWRHYYWLDVQALAEQIVGPEHELARVKYFTAPIKVPHDKMVRHSAYLRSIRSLSKVKVIEGYYQKKNETYTCTDCGVSKKVDFYVEKKTDVNIATELLCDSFDEETCGYDKAIIITADNDLTSPVSSYRKIHRNKKKIIVALPPSRPGIPEPHQLKQAGNKSIYITEDHLKAALLPRYVQTTDSVEVCPDGWLPASVAQSGTTADELAALLAKFKG